MGACRENRRRRVIDWTIGVVAALIIVSMALNIAHLIRAF